MFGKALRDEEIVRLTLDARVGGEFSFVVRRLGHEIDHVGRYLEIERPRRLAFTWGIAREAEDEGSRVVVEIAARGTGCELTLTHPLPPEWAAYEDRARDGWSKMVGALAEGIALARRSSTARTQAARSVRSENRTPCLRSLR